MSQQRITPQQLVEYGVDLAKGTDATILIVKDGNSAELFYHGKPQDIGQLLDALMRRFGLVDEGAPA